MASALRIVCLSDTHSRHRDVDVPDGDVLVHAGDFTKRGGLAEVAAFDAWLATLPHAHKIVVAGNHDFLFERQPQLARATLTHALYLEHEAAEVAGLRVFGSPWQPWFHDWAFNLPRGAALREKWAQVPEGLDLLVTHTPPHGVLDLCFHGARVGCEELRSALPRLRPRLHVFGHIHEAYGSLEVDDFPGTRFVNASICDLSYRAVQRAVVVDLPRA